MRRIAFLVLALVASASFASGNNNGPSQNCNGNGSCSTSTTNNISNKGGEGGNANASAHSTNVNANTNVNSNKQGQQQGQLQGQMQGQGQLQGQSQNASNDGNKQSTNVTINEGDTPKQATSGPGIASSPSATCRIAVGASVGGTFGGFGAFGSVEDERCADMERGRYMAEVLGRKDAAKALACQDEKMAKALGDCKSEKVAYKSVDAIVPASNTGRDPFRHTGE